MRTEIRSAALIAGWLLAAAGPGEAGGFKSAAKELSQAARAAGITRVVVLPFVPADDSSAKDGWNISEKLTTQVVRAGKVRAIERSLLRGVLEEHQLAQTGLVDRATLKKIGRVLAAEAVITGSFVTIGRELAVNLRLIEVETGVVLFAAERQLAREWEPAQPSSWGPQAAIEVPVPELFVSAPSFTPTREELRDSLREDACAGASERVDELENRILELKARYWADQLRKGVSGASLKVNPGSTITDPLLRRRFYERLKFWFDAAEAPELSPAEVKLFISIDGRAYSLYRECGV